MEEASPILVRLRENLGHRYSIERELGRGGMATVFLARDLKHDREVAIKVLHPELSASIGADRFEREIKLAAKLQHPNILGLYDSGVADGLLYYVMPFVKGEALRDRLDREGMLPIEDAVSIALQVASALGHAHEHGIVHRDIKPENILLAGDHILVADFGIARAATEADQQKLTQTGMAVGTPVYMAPEQSTGDAVGSTADLYSLGCMLYEMLTGEAPFTGPNAMAIMAKHLMEQVPSVRVTRQAVPESIEQAIFITLNKQPIDRPQTAKQFAELLGMSLGSTGMMRTMRASMTMRDSMTMRGSRMGMLAMSDEHRPPPVPRWKKPVAWAGGGAAVAAAAALIFAMTGNPKPQVLDPDANRVAVLYFEDASRDSSLRSVADGITEELIRALDGISSLQVISRGGVEPYRGSTLEVDTIARALRAGYVVQGDLEPAGDAVRVNVRLADRLGNVVKRGNVPVSRDSLLGAQGAVAALVADLIRQELGGDVQLQRRRSATASNQAWLAVQQAAKFQRDAMARRGAGDAEGMNGAFLAADSVLAIAEQLDRRWVEPVTRRAVLAYQRSRLGGAGARPEVIRPWVESAIAHADRALALDAEDPDALEVRGNARYWGVLTNLSVNEATRMTDLRAAQADLELATRLNPRQAGAYSTLSHMYYQLPDKTADNVLAAAIRALEADEFQANVVLVRARLFFAAFDLGRFDAAEQYCNELERRYSGDSRAIRCRLYLQSIPSIDSVDVTRAWRLADSLTAASPGDTIMLLTGHMWTAAAIARASDKSPDGSSRRQILADSARAVARRAIGDATVEAPRGLAYYGAYVSSILGDRDEAIRRLETYIAVDPSNRATALRNDPTWMFRRYEEDPRFRQAVSIVR